MNWFRKPQIPSQDVTASILADEKSFYQQFYRDLLEAKQEVIIESPFITISRLRSLKSIFELLIKRGVGLFIITRFPKEHDEVMSEQSETGIQYFEALGGQVLLCEGHHRKMALIDRKVVWIGSLNILSQSTVVNLWKEKKIEKK